MRGWSEIDFLHFLANPAQSYFKLKLNCTFTASLSLKCDKDWLRDEEVESHKVTMIYFLDLHFVCFDVETACISSFITMKLQIHTIIISTMMSMIQATTTLLLNEMMFCSAFPQCCWPWSTLTSSHECCYFTEINRRVVCNCWIPQVLENNKNRQSRGCKPQFFHQPTSA